MIKPKLLSPILLVLSIFFAITIGRKNKPAVWRKSLLSQFVVLLLLHPNDLCVLHNSSCTRGWVILGSSGVFSYPKCCPSLNLI